MIIKKAVWTTYFFVTILYLVSYFFIRSAHEKEIVDLKNQIIHLELKNDELNREILRLRHHLDNLNTVVDLFIYDIKEDFMVLGTRNSILY